MAAANVRGPVVVQDAIIETVTSTPVADPAATSSEAVRSANPGVDAVTSGATNNTMEASTSGVTNSNADGGAARAPAVRNTVSGTAEPSAARSARVSRADHEVIEVSSDSEDDSQTSRGPPVLDRTRPSVSSTSSSATESNEDGNSEDRDPEIPGTPGSSYGGYGRCYTCGRRGHWAPGCPF